MKRVLVLVSMAALVAGTGCGGTESILGDAFNLGGGDMSTGPGDMAQVKLFRLQSGVWKVNGPVRIGQDACSVNPNDPNNPTANQIWALVNDGNGGIKLGNPTDPNNPGNPQQYGADTGTPAQPPQGASCPGGNANPAQCATEPNAMAFNNNMGTLVRDNDVGLQGGCTYHRHAVNQLTLTADGAFTAQYTRKDTNHMTCMATMDCTTTWAWDFVFVKQFGQ